MSTEIERVVETIGPEVTLTEEVPMVRQERWEELRRLWQQERVPIAELARRFELDPTLPDASSPPGRWPGPRWFREWT
jgi:hypothetical protein